MDGIKAEDAGGQEDEYCRLARVGRYPSITMAHPKSNLTWGGGKDAHTHTHRTALKANTFV